jgi:class 3 adenylate cyclase/DNA-binding NarL/FixJ family response regulator
MSDTTPKITVFLADDNLIVRNGVKALLALEPDLEIVGTAADYDGLVNGAEEAAPQVIVTDIRMPPTFTREGIDAAKEVRRRHPGTGIVILSQYDDPEYAISLLSEGAAGYGYLLKDHVAEEDRLARAVREVAAGGSMLDPKIVSALARPIAVDTGLTSTEEQLLTYIAEGKPIKAIAAATKTTPAAVSDEVEALFLKLAQDASAGNQGSLKRLRMLHQAIIDREEQGETLSRLLPGGVADKLKAEGRRIGETESLVVTVLMCDIRGYSAISERSDPSSLARQLCAHRAEMNRAILDNGGTVMQFVGDAVMAVFGAPLPQDDHADHALAAALQMHELQEAVNKRWADEGLPPFPLGIGLSSGEVAAALLGSDERMEYTVVGDTVNLSQRLQDWARPGGQTVLSEATFKSLSAPIDAAPMEPQLVKGRETPVVAYKLG